MAFVDVLRAELLTDPKALGYATKTDAQVATAMNAAGSGTAINRTLIEAYEIINATVPAEYAALTAAEKQRYDMITGAGRVDASNANVRAAFAAMFGAATTTRPALVALQTQQQTRSEELFGFAVSTADITAARA